MKKGTDIGEAIKINEDGYVWIVDGQVFVKNQIGSGMPPLINPHGEVRLYYKWYGGKSYCYGF